MAAPVVAKLAPASVKESVLKMASLVDQTDESELLPPDASLVQTWLQRYTLTKGGPPEEEDDPTTLQLVALRKRVVQLQQAPHVDFGVRVPFSSTCPEGAEIPDVHTIGDGTFLMRELRPKNFQQWVSW